MTGLAPRDEARVWVPAPSTIPAQQDIAVVRGDFPAGAGDTVETRYRNKLIYFGSRPDADGVIAFSVTYRVVRHECGAALPTTIGSRTAADLLAPDALVPVGGKPAALLAGKAVPADPLAALRALYDLVDDHMRYRKDQPGWGRGDAAWACDSRFGNCTDFHSLFISLARTSHIAARFEIGFGLPEARGKGEIAGYHCWAWGSGGERGWLPVDISEANKHPEKRDYFFGHLCENRVAFSTGRDLVLEPKQDGPPINFLIYPYVEVAGKPWPADQVERHFSYEDLPDAKEDKK